MAFISVLTEIIQHRLVRVNVQWWSIQYARKKCKFCIKWKRCIFNRINSTLSLTRFPAFLSYYLFRYGMEKKYQFAQNRKFIYVYQLFRHLERLNLSRHENRFLRPVFQFLFNFSNPIIYVISNLPKKKNNIEEKISAFWYFLIDVSINHK